MEPWLTTIITVVCSVVASSGFWTFLHRRHERKDAKSRMILGLGHGRLLSLCVTYINRGSITHEELSNLHEYLYEPYSELGGNGTVTRLMEKVNALPISQLTNYFDEGEK